MTSISTNVQVEVQIDFKAKANALGLSINQYLKLLVLRDLGVEPPMELTYADLPDWLRGR